MEGRSGSAPRGPPVFTLASLSIYSAKLRASDIKDLPLSKPLTGGKYTKMIIAREEKKVTDKVAAVFKDTFKIVHVENKKVEEAVTKKHDDQAPDDFDWNKTPAYEEFVKGKSLYESLIGTGLAKVCM